METFSGGQDSLVLKLYILKITKKNLVCTMSALETDDDDSVPDCLKLVWSGFQMDLTRLGVHLVSELQIILKVNQGGIVISLVQSSNDILNCIIPQQIEIRVNL